MDVARILLKPAEAARALGIGNTKLYELIADGTIPSIKLGKSVRIPVEQLKQFVNDQTADRMSTHHEAR